MKHITRRSLFITVSILLSGAIMLPAISETLTILEKKTDGAKKTTPTNFTIPKTAITTTTLAHNSTAKYATAPHFPMPTLKSQKVAH